MTNKEIQVVEREDNYEDILGKAMRGLGIGKSEMASRLGIDKARIETVLAGGDDNVMVIAGMAQELSLSTSKLIASVTNEWHLVPLEMECLKQFNLPFSSMRVNTYILWCNKTAKAWVFDTGPDAAPILEFLEKVNLSVDAIFLTHTHSDHIACLEKLKQKTLYPPVFVHELEAIDEANSIDEGFEYKIESLSLSSLHTHGHSVGGTTYLISGLERPVAIVGDSLFAGSMGGGMISYADALRTNREKIMSLPDDTVLCPGHGPMTTVGEEKKHNPFFPEF